MVLLKPDTVKSPGTFHFALHSTMVLLKPTMLPSAVIAVVYFTFHYGLIKTNEHENIIDEHVIFTFHYGLIKTLYTKREIK